MVTDGLPGLTLVSKPSESNIMSRTSAGTKENIFAEGTAIPILWVGLLMDKVTLGMQAWTIHYNNNHWQTMVFTVLCLSQMGHVMAIRSELESIFKIGLLSNKPMLVAVLFTFILQMMIIYTLFLTIIFRTQPLTLYELVIPNTFLK
jgi:Ca2+-transporting ATPase